VGGEVAEFISSKFLLLSLAANIPVTIILIFWEIDFFLTSSSTFYDFLARSANLPERLYILLYVQLPLSNTLEVFLQIGCCFIIQLTTSEH